MNARILNITVIALNEDKSATTNIYGDITCNNNKVLMGQWSICRRKRSIIVTDNTMQAEGLGDFFKNLGKRTECIKTDGRKRIKQPRTSFA